MFGKWFRSSESIYLLASAIIIFIGAVRIIDSYNFNSPTVDEKAHIGAGMQWLKEGRYTYEPKHPPLARIAAALGPYLDRNVNFVPTGMSEDGRAIIFANNDPVRNISLARLGILPFFLVASLFVYLWAKQCAGAIGGLIAVFLFTSLPSILAHAGLATTDMALVATFIVVIYAFQQWLSSSTMLWSAFFGVALGFTLLAKMSALLFLPTCLSAITIWALLIRFRSDESILTFIRCKISWGILSVAVAFVVLWAGYQFSLQPISTVENRPHEVIDALFGSIGFLHSGAYFLLETPLPAVEFFKGIEQTFDHVEYIRLNYGRPSYLFGETRQHGWWYFFPLALLVKTPIATLLLFLFGSWYMLYVAFKTNSWLIAVPFICTLTLMLVVLPSTINIGSRHILPIYGFMAIVASYGAVKMFVMMKSRLAAITLVGSLLLWQGISSAFVHRDYIPYFNELARLTNDPILVDSDRDWGQSVWQLRDYVIKHNIDEIKVALIGFSQQDLDRYRYNFPHLALLDPYDRQQGWIAVGAYKLYTDDGYKWLRDVGYVDMIGNSIFVFHLQDN